NSAIRITHLPSGVVVECQEERSQHKNRAKAMALLAARLKQSALESRQREQAAERKSLVGSGDRSERIRTYNFPQGRLTDHRINLTLYRLNEIVAGDLDGVVSALLAEHQAEQVAALADRQGEGDAHRGGVARSPAQAGRLADPGPGRGVAAGALAGPLAQRFLYLAGTAPGRPPTGCLPEPGGAPRDGLAGGLPDRGAGIL